MIMMSSESCVANKCCPSPDCSTFQSFTLMLATDSVISIEKHKNTMAGIVVKIKRSCAGEE